MTFEKFGGAEAADAGAPGSGVYSGHTTNDAIIASPGGFPGTYSYSIDPVNGNVLTEVYGFRAFLPDSPSLLTVPFMFRFAADFDDEVGIAELGDVNPAGNIARRLIIGTDETLQILDEGVAQVGVTGNFSYVIANTDYWLLWYVDLREEANSRDILWVYRPAVSFVSAGVTFADVDPDTMTMAAAEGARFIDGDVITVAGSASNNGSYTIDDRTAGVITLDAGDALTNEGPVGATLSTPARWDKAIDETGHGDGDYNEIDVITFGSSTGKGLPTVGGPFYVDEMAVQVLNVSPNTTAIGSITTTFLIPTGNGTDGDFDTGTGTNPDWNDVKEIPPDDVTSYDEGDTDGDQQSYAITNPGEAPLAVQVVGQAAKAGGGGGATVTPRTYILESGTRDYSESWTSSINTYRILRASAAGGKTYNEINAQTITESIVNGSEAGVELVDESGGATFRLSQIGLEYMVEGPQSLPDDFPTMGVTTITGKAPGVMLGTANPGIL